METIEVPTLLEEDATVPEYGSEYAAGADVRAHIKQNVILEPGASVLIPTGLRFAIPEGFEIQIRPRSGLALKNQITVLNTPGTIDADFRGEVGIILINHGKNPFIITPKMRLAQLILCRVFKAEFVKEAALTTTQRQEGGFGHTGTH